MKDSKRNWIIAGIVVLALFFLFDSGIIRSAVCASVGGIWCYWPYFSRSRILDIGLIMLFALVLVWLAQRSKGKRKKR